MRSLTALTVAVGSLALATSATAATLTVDDDGQDCPSASFSSIQGAVDAAAKNDTIVVCAGDYVEGSGNPGTNAVSITKSLTIKGVGADLVTISPKANGPQSTIAAASPNLRDAVGNIVGIIGDPDFPLTVNISGVTVDGAGVASEAGVLYLDAMGSYSRSRVTDVVTSMGPNAFSIPGGYRSAQLGYGLAQVTAATVTPAQTGTRVLTLDATRVDGYNTAGVLISGATGETPPLTNSGVVNRAVISNSQVVGRTQCVNYEANGTCGGSQLALLTTGPLFGQDGVRIAGGATTAITGSLISQNLVNGTGAPTRSTIVANGTVTSQTANNANLVRGSGVRLVAAGTSTIATSNIVDNAYGVQNLLADGTSAQTTQMKAENNWWGLNYYRGGATGAGQAVNPGPAVSPAANPPIPENPVNGTAVSDPVLTSLLTSSAVDFVPFRDGPQSAADSGEYVVYNAPGPVSDAAPTVSLGNVSAAVGSTATLTATAEDDYAVKQVTFLEGATPLETVSYGPYSLDVVIPADATCGVRTFTAVVEDSSGQTASASGTLTVTDCPTTPPPTTTTTTTTTPPPAPVPPSVVFATSTKTVESKGTEFGVVPTAAAGVAKVEYLLGTRKVCTATSAPYSCKIVPNGGETGKQSLRVVLTDGAGATAEATREVTVARFATSLSLKVGSTPVKGGKSRKTIGGKLKLPSAVTTAQGCQSGSVTVVVKKGSSTVSNSQVKLSSSCRFTKSITVKRTKKKTTYTVSAKFGGNTVLLPTSNDRRFS